MRQLCQHLIILLVCQLGAAVSHLLESAPDGARTKGPRLQAQQQQRKDSDGSRVSRKLQAGDTQIKATYSTGRERCQYECHPDASAASVSIVGGSVYGTVMSESIATALLHCSKNIILL